LSLQIAKNLLWWILTCLYSHMQNMIGLRTSNSMRLHRTSKLTKPGMRGSLQNLGTENTGFNLKSQTPPGYVWTSVVQVYLWPRYPLSGIERDILP
jgi:hypothetical protein